MTGNERQKSTLKTSNRVTVVRKYSGSFSVAPFFRFWMVMLLCALATKWKTREQNVHRKWRKKKRSKKKVNREQKGQTQRMSSRREGKRGNENDNTKRNGYKVECCTWPKRKTTITVDNDNDKRRKDIRRHLTIHERIFNTKITSKLDARRTRSVPCCRSSRRRRWPSARDSLCVADNFQLFEFGFDRILSSTLFRDTSVYDANHNAVHRSRNVTAMLPNSLTWCYMQCSDKVESNLYFCLKT